MNPYQSPTIESDPPVELVTKFDVFVLGISVGIWSAATFILAVDHWFPGAS